MSNATSEILACENVQRELNDHFVVCDPSLQQRRSKFLEMVTSPQNTSGLKFEVSPMQNKVRTVTLRYDQKVSVSDVTEVTECDIDCVADNSIGDKSANYTIDPCEKVKYQESYSAVQFQYMCRTQEDYLNKRILIMTNAIEEKIATKSAAEAVLLQGNWASV